jgi:hypothetical protein
MPTATLTGPLQHGAATVLDPATGELLGYAFTEAKDAGQRQRWLLHRHPRNSLSIGAAPTEMAAWTLSDWKANVPELWRPGSYYVRAQADVYSFGATHDNRVWDHLPDDYLLPKPTYPADDDPFQFDPIGTLVGLSGLDHAPRGLIFVAGQLDAASNAEYWLLFPGFTPAAGSARVTATSGTIEAPDLRAFVGVANRSWTAGATLAITGCRNFHDVTGAGTLPRIL